MNTIISDANAKLHLTTIAKKLQMRGFREFLFRGNLIQLAVAVVVGAAFSNLVTAFTTGLITPILGIFGTQPNFTDHSFTINKSRFQYGLFIDALFAFFITALILYYIVVVPSEWVLEKFIREHEVTQRPCPECTSIISRLAKRCPFCTERIEPMSPPPGFNPDEMEMRPMRL